MDDDLNLFIEDHINGGYGNVLDELASHECMDGPGDYSDEPWDAILAEQELKNFEQADEYFGCYDDFDNDY